MNSELVVDGHKVDPEHLDLALAILRHFNELNESDLRGMTTVGLPTRDLESIVRRIREAPGLSLEDHQAIMGSNFADPWWPEVKAGCVNVIYSEKTWPRCSVKPAGVRGKGFADARPTGVWDEKKPPW